MKTGMKELEERILNVWFLSFTVFEIKGIGLIKWLDVSGEWRMNRNLFLEDPKTSLEKVVDTYGYFGMGPFLIPSVRRKKVAWFMEKYLEARVKYPNAKFSYIDHSHGTYILTKALETYKQCYFDNVCFCR